MVTLVIFLIKNNLNRHIKHENPLSIYENVDYFQIMTITVVLYKLYHDMINDHKVTKPVLPLDCHLSTQNTTYTIKLQ